MNKLMQQLEDAKHALTEAMDGTEAEAIKSATEAVKAAQAAVDAAKEGEALIASFGTHQGEADPEQPAKSLGEYAVKHLDLTAMRLGAAKSAGTGFGFKAATDAHTSQQMLVVDQNVVDITSARDLAIRSLFGAETISGNALKYFILGAKEAVSGGAPAVTAEGAAKPQFHIPVTPATATLSKIAGWYYETDELIEDNAFLRSSIDNRGLFELDLAVESYLLSTLLGTSGLGAATYAHNGNVSADDIFAAMMTVKGASNYNADAIVINPADYQRLRLAKDGGNSGQYYGGGYFYGPYGNGGNAQQPGLWGLNTVITSSIAAGTVLVGNFKQGASVITKAGDGQRVEIVTGDHDDRVSNRVTVIVEERLALATRVPSAFVKITEAAS
jgi:HK97 family phage major capsid protein